MKKLKLKLFLLGVVLVIGSIINLFFSSIIHFQLKNGIVKLISLDLKTCIGSLVSNHQHLMLFLCLEGVILLLGLMLVFSSKSNTYESDMKQITPKITTPVAAGQSQHGSARWLEKDKIHKVFAKAMMSNKNPLVKELIAKGYATVKDKNKIANKARKQIKASTNTKTEQEKPKKQLSIVSKGWDHSRFTENKKQ